MIDQTIKFKDLFKIPTKNGLSKPSRVIGEGKKIIMMNEIFAQRRIRNVNMKRVPVSETEIKSHGLKKGDLLFARTSLKFEGAGKCVIFEGDKETVVYESNLIRCRLDENKVNTHFYYYYFNTYEGRKIIESILMETAATSMRGSDLSELQVPYFDISFQNIVAKTLSSIEDKIELAQKMNQSLEEIAKTLFKSWFIDFDPVRAKVEGRPTGLSKEISDLFPDSFEDSELDEMPKGWNLLTFGDFVTPIRGKVITKKTTNPGDIPVVAGGLEPAYFHSIANVEGPAITISASGANAGYTNLYFEDIWASDCSYISNKQSSNVFTSYIFLKLNQERIFDSQHGAAQPHIYPDDLRRLDMVIPSNDLYATFENLITSFFNKIKLNIEETKNLISLRDALLPKLISGELQIPDAENLVEEAGI
jgi:type I restriction enzyme S subunit